MEENEQLQNQDANTPEQTSDAPQAEQDGGDKPQSQETKTDLPFHEHPRWKEVINERNQYATKVQELERRFEEFSRQRQAQQAPTTPAQDKLIERLKGIDPEFAERAAKWETASQRAERLEQELQSYRVQAQQDQARSQLEQLHTQNKVPAELQSLYQAQLKELANSNPNLGLKDLPSMYQQVHSGIQKYLESYKRQALAEYTKGKAQDSVPSAPKGQAAKPTQKKDSGFTGDREADMAEIARRAAQTLRAQRNA